MPLQDCERSAGDSNVSAPSTLFKPRSLLSQKDARAVHSTKKKNDSEIQSLLEQLTATLDGWPNAWRRQCGIWVCNCPVFEAKADVKEGKVRGRNNAANIFLP